MRTNLFNTLMWFGLTLGIGLWAAGANAQTVPVNDAFASSTVLSGATNTVAASNVGANKESGEPDHAGDYGGASVWWSWVALASGPVTVSTVGSTFDTVLGVYTGTNLAALALVAADDDRGGARTSWLRFNATAGATYKIAVDGWGGATGKVLLTVQQAAPQPPVIVLQPVSVTNRVGTAAAFRAAVTGTRPLNFQWFKDGSALTNAVAPELWLRHVKTNDGGGYTFVTTNAVGSVTSSVASLTILLPPANDDFATRSTLSGATNTATSSNTNASFEPGEPAHAREHGGASVWWSWVAPVSGSVTVNTVGSTFDTLLAIYTGTNVAALTLVAADDDSGGGNTSRLTFYATAGIEYALAVDGWRDAQGTVVMTLTQPTPSPFAPVILTQPDSVSLVRTNPAQVLTATFTVVATNATDYQWRLNGTAIANATNTTLTITPARPGDSGSYSVLVGNEFGSVLSRNAGLKVLWTRPFWGLRHGGNGQFQAAFDTSASTPLLPAQVYVEFTTNFVQWTALTNACVVTNGHVIFDTGGATTNSSHRFYRILER